MSKHEELKMLPLFENTQDIHLEKLFIKKLQQCCVLFDSSMFSFKSRVVKEVTLTEMKDYVLNKKGAITESTYPEIVQMFSCNAFRTLPSKPRREEFDPDINEPALRADPLLLLVYEFFLTCLESPRFKTKIGKRYIDQNFVHRLLPLFDCKNYNERDFLMKILHRIYAKFRGLRVYIRKQINIVFYIFIYETGHHDGINELLVLMSSIIQGLCLPLKEEFKSFLMIQLISLHKAESLHDYHTQLVICIQNFIEKDSRLTEPIIKSLLKIWPKMNSRKEILFLNELEELMEGIRPAQFPKVMVPVFQQLAKCAVSAHHLVAKTALFFVANESIMNLVEKYVKILLPIMFPALYQTSHWNTTVYILAYNAMSVFMQMDQQLFDECEENYERNNQLKETKMKEREAAWSKIETLASQNREIKERESLNASNKVESASADLPMPADDNEKLQRIRKVVDELQAGRKNLSAG